jgi:hypothetical protein
MLLPISAFFTASVSLLFAITTPLISLGQDIGALLPALRPIPASPELLETYLTVMAELVTPWSLRGIPHATVGM